MCVEMMRVLKGAAILLIGSGVILAFMQLKENQVECYSPSASSMPRDYVNSVCINRGLYTVNKNILGWTRWTLGKPERTYYPSYRYLWIYLIVGGLLALTPLKFGDTTTLPWLLKTPSNCPDKKKMRRKNALKFIFQCPKSCSTLFYRHFLAVLSIPLTLALIILSLNSYLNGGFIFLPFSQYKDSLDEIFPKFAACDVNVTSAVSPSTVEVATCELLQNDFNRTIFLILWYFLMPLFGLVILFTTHVLQGMFVPSIWADDIAILSGIAEEEDQDKEKFKEQVKPFKKLGNSQALVALELKFLMGEVEYREFIKDLEKHLSNADSDLERGISIC